MTHRQFWREHPALLLAISFLIGSGVALFSLPLWIAALWLLYCLWIRKWASAIALPLSIVYALLLYGSMPTLTGPTHSTAPFSVSSIQPHQSPFHRDLLIRGTYLLNGAQLPCSIYIPIDERPTSHSDYLVTGLLHQRGPYDYILKSPQWKPIPRTFTLANLRYQTKQSFRKFLHAKLSRPRTATLLSSLATGEIEDRLLRYEFGRLGLQHILAISGFHFGVLMAFFSFFLSLFLPSRWKWLSLVFLTTLYYLFIGSSPAVQRAWITASLFLLSKLLGRHTPAINLLGAALLIELLLNPLVASNLGFQLSFGCSLGILLLHKPMEKLLQPYFPARTAAKSQTLPLLSQVIYLFSTTFRTAISLTLAVNITILPLLLFHFGKFPYLSLLYNLFYPFMISLALSGLLATLLIHLLCPPLAIPLFALLDGFTHNLLQITTYPPLLLDYSLYIPQFPLELIPFYLALLLFISIPKTNPINA